MIELQERPAGLHQPSLRHPTPQQPSLTDAERAEVQRLLLPSAPRPEAMPSDVVAAPVGATQAWAPASSQRIRVAEGVVIVSTMAYFATGLLGALGLV